MEILFLGTSSGWPLPRFGCGCEICSSDKAYDKRLRPSVFVNQKILLDTNFDIYHQIKKFKIDPTKITHIILTHGHLDHITGLYDLSHTYNLEKKIEVLGSHKTLTAARKFMGAGKRLVAKEIKPREKVSLDGNLSCVLIPVEHGAIETFAIKLTEGKKEFIYAPEFRTIPSPSQKLIKNADILVIDGSSKTTLGRAKGHETIEEGMAIAKRLKARATYFTNIGHKTDEHDKLESFVQKEGAKTFHIAYDGLKLWT